MGLNPYRSTHCRSVTVITYQKKIPGLQLPQLLGVSLSWNEKNDINPDGESVGVVEFG